MCSNCDDCHLKSAIVNEPDQVKRCRKCNSEQAFIVLDGVHVDCRKCFLESCNRKIRSTVGGPSSLALLDLVKNSIESEARREQKFRPSIVHIDTQSVLNRNMHELRMSRGRNIDELLGKIRVLCPKWPIYYSSIEMLYSRTDSQTDADTGKPRFSLYQPDKLDESILFNSSALANFSQHLSKLDNLTDRHQFVQTKVMELVSEISGEINLSIEHAVDKFKFALLGSSASQLANDLLVSVILGQGSSIRARVSICDHRNQVALMRPMRDFSKKEILFYLRARNIEHNYRVEPNLITFADRKSSIQTVTEAFVAKLQLEYPSTCSTLLRTGNKMQD